MALEPRKGPHGDTFFVPADSGPGRYPKMSQEERDKLYRSTKEALSGDLRTAPRNNLGNVVWNELASPSLNYGLSKPATALKGMPVSQAILDAMTQQNGSGGLGGRKPREVMFYCLDYLQNAEENRFVPGTPGKGDAGISNIDKVMREDTVQIYNEGGRWKLRVIKEDGTNRMDGFLFPPRPAPHREDEAQHHEEPTEEAEVEDHDHEPTEEAEVEDHDHETTETEPEPEPEPPTEETPVYGSHISEKAVVQIRSVHKSKPDSLNYLERVYNSIADEDRPHVKSNYDLVRQQIKDSNEANEESRYESLTNFLSLLYENRISYQEIEGGPNVIPANDETTRLVAPAYAPEEPPAFERATLNVPEVTPERINAAKQALEEAYTIIKSEIYAKAKEKAEAPGASYEDENGFAMLEDLISKPFDPSDYLPLMIKESRLDPNAHEGTARGLFQIEPIVQKEVKMYYGYEAENLLDPTQNAITGIIFLHRCLEHYAKNEAFGEISEGDRDLLAYAIYNKGFANVKQVWEATSATSFEGFEKGISEAIRDQLKPGTTAAALYETVHDDSYNVDYRQYDGVQLYLESGKTDLGNHALDETLMIGGQPMGITVRQGGIMLRYPRLIEGLDSGVAGLPAPQGGAELPESTGEIREVKPNTAESIELVEYTVKAGDSLWKIGREYGVGPMYLRRINGLSSNDIGVNQVLKVPKVNEGARDYLYTGTLSKPWIGVTPGKGFWNTLVKNESYNEYLKSEIQLDKEEITDVILDFNRRFNPELMTREGFTLKDDAGNIPEGAQIWVPNVDYFIAYYQGTIDQPEPGAEEIPESSPELPPSPKSGPATELPSPPEALSEISEALDKTTAGQYVRRVGNRWIRDVDAMRAGAKSFELKRWEDHPEWDAGNLGNRQLFNGRAKLEDVQFIILHSTASTSSNHAVDNKKAHFVVEKDGTIRYVVHADRSTAANNKVPPHAGKSEWQGVSDLNRHSLGIEVVAQSGKDWTNDQYEAIQELTNWLGGYYGLEKRDVVLHKQIVDSVWGQRGRKSDPYGDPSQLFSRLGLPDNSALLDMEVARGTVAPHPSITNHKEGHQYGEWEGYSAARYLRERKVQSAPPTIDRTAVEVWKREIESLAEIKNHTVVAGDTLYNLAERYSTGIEHIMAYNDLTTSAIKLGQVLKIPTPKE